MKKEKGQALPLAIIVLTIGALLIAPFLGHASSSMIGSQTYGSAIDYRTACDAGIEHAIWRLQYSGLANQIPDIGDQITYQLAEAINGITPTIIITTNSSSGGAGSGEEGIIDDYKFEPSVTYEAKITKIADQVYAMVTNGPSNKGILYTVAIADDGIITHSIISSLQFDSTCFSPDMIHVSGTVYAIAYRGSSNRGYIKTVNITDEGDISHSVIDTLRFDNSACYEPSITLVSGDVYAIVYRGYYNRGYLKTVTIAANGDIGSSEIDSMIFDIYAGYEPKIIQTSGSIFAIAYRGQSNLGMLATVNIAANGDIGSSIISSLVTDTALGLDPDIIKISDTIYAVIFTCIFNWPDLKTVNIAEDGTITQTIIDAVEYTGFSLYQPHIIHVSDNIFLFCGRTDSNKGMIKKVEIAPDGTITNGDVHTFLFTCSGFYPDIVLVSSDVAAVTRWITGNSGHVTTIGLTAMDWTVYHVFASAENTSIEAYIWISDNSTYILSWRLE